jgi:hypothetical protein
MQESSQGHFFLGDDPNDQTSVQWFLMVPYLQVSYMLLMFTHKPKDRVNNPSGK